MSDDLSPKSYESNGRVDEQDEENQQKEVDRVRLRLITAVTRGAAVGFILRGGLSIVATLSSLLANKRPKSDRKLVPEVLRMTLFLATLGGSYVLTDEAIGALLGKRSTASWRGLVAGLCAGPSILFLGQKTKHYSLATYVFVRSLTLLIRCANHSSKLQIVRWMLAPTRMEHGDVVLMCLTSAQIIYSFCMMPHTIPKSYRHFLTRQTCRPLYVWQTIREMASNEICSKGIPQDRFPSLQGTRHVPFFSSIPCGVLHPNTSCVGNIFSVFPEAYLRAVTVYLPVYVAPALLVHRKNLLKEYKTILPKVLFGILRSSLFLSSLISMGYLGVCSVHNITKSTSGWTLGGSLLFAGLAALAEKKSRRMELSLYALARAAESFAFCLVDWGYLKSTKWRLDVLLFSLGSAFITHCYSDDEGTHRHSFRAKYLNVLDFVFGNTGIHSGEIHHIPSNQDLLKMGSHWWNRRWFRTS